MNRDLDAPKYIEVKNIIKKKILSGEISGKLPGERILAEQFGYSYMTIRNAVNELVNDGLLYRIERKGTYVSKIDRSVNITGNIGFFLPEKIVGGIYGPYYSLVFHWIEKEASDNGLNLMFFSRLDDLPPLQLKKKVDGVIVAYFPDMRNAIADYSRYLPITCIDNIFDSPHIPSVVFDNFNGIYSSVNYLASLGNKRIGFISGLLDSEIGQKRMDGYLAAVKDCGLDDDPNLIFQGDYDFKKGVEGAEHLLSLDNAPKAIVCANDNMAFGVIRTAAARGLKIPTDLSVIGFDDIEPASHMTPPLTTIHVPLNIMAKASVKNLLDLLNGNTIENPAKIIPTQLIIRDSTIKG